MPGIDTRNVKAAEVGSVVGSQGLANEFAGIGEMAGAFVKGVAGIHQHVELTKAKDAKAKTQAELAEFQIGQLETNIEQNTQSLEANFSDEELQNFRKAQSFEERLTLAEQKGGSAVRSLLRTKRMRALADAIARDPANREEYVKIFKAVPLDKGEDLENKLDPIEEARVRAQAQLVQSQATALANAGYITAVDIGNLSPAQISEKYENSGLAKLTRQAEAMDLQATVLEKGEKITEANVTRALDDFEKDNPNVIRGSIFSATSATLEEIKGMGDISQSERAAFVKAEKAKIVAALQQKTGGLSREKIESRYANELAVYDTLEGYDPVAESGQALENQIKYLSVSVFEDQITSNGDLLAAKALQDGLPTMMRDIGVQSLFGRKFTTALTNIMQDNPADLSSIHKFGKQSPAEAGDVLSQAANAVAFDDAPAEVQAATLITMTEALGLDYGEGRGEIIGRTVEQLSNPIFAEAWAKAASESADPEAAQLQIKRAGRQFSQFISDAITALEGNLGEQAQFVIDEKAGTISLANGTGPNSTALVGKINAAIKSIAHMNGTTDYARILREFE